MKKITGIVLAVMMSLCATPHLDAAMEITPRLSVGAEYTDNVYLVSEDFAETESDTITSITPGITIDLSGRSAGLALSYDPSYVDYYDDAYDEYWSHAASADGWWQAARNTRLSLTHAFLQTEDPIDEFDLTIRRSRNRYTRNTTSARVEHQFGTENSVYADGQYSSLENEDPTIEDTQYYGGGAGMAYWFNVRWGVEIGGDYYLGRYDEGLDDYAETTGRLRGILSSRRRTRSAWTSPIDWIRWEGSLASIRWIVDWRAADRPAWLPVGYEGSWFSIAPTVSTGVWPVKGFLPKSSS